MKGVYVRRNFVAVRVFGWQIDYRDWLPPRGLRPRGWASHWIVIPVAHRRWITIGRVR